jgi:UDP-N-acetyl-D-mannosaminuronate dehydrogenase
MKGAQVLLLGVTYKPDIADQRESPAVALARLLVNLGAKLRYHDPYVTKWEMPEAHVPRAEDVDAAVAEADLVILVQGHRGYDVEALAAKAIRFFDTRGLTSGQHSFRL